MTPRQPLPPPLRLLSDPLPVGEATELQPLAVIERHDRHAWDEWDMATVMMDLDAGQLPEAVAS